LHLASLILLFLLVECWLAQDSLEATALLNLGVVVWYFMMIHVCIYLYMAYDIIVMSQRKMVAAGIPQMHDN